MPTSPHNSGFTSQTTCEDIRQPSRGAIGARALHWRHPHEVEGAGKAGSLPPPWPACRKNAGGSHHRFGQDIPALPARTVLTAYTRSPRGPALLPPSSARSSRRGLELSTGRSGPHDFAVRACRSSAKPKLRCSTPRPSHSVTHVRDDRDTPLRRNGTRRQYA